MIIHATRIRRVPRWYVRRVMRHTQRLVVANPGFHRLVINIDTVPVSVESGYLVNPDVEPDVRRLLGRVLVLTPPLEDDEPWPSL